MLVHSHAHKVVNMHKMSIDATGRPGLHFTLAIGHQTMSPQCLLARPPARTKLQNVSARPAQAVANASAPSWPLRFPRRPPRTSPAGWGAANGPLKVGLG